MFTNRASFFSHLHLIKREITVKYIISGINNNFSISMFLNKEAFSTFKEKEENAKREINNLLLCMDVKSAYEIYKKLSCNAIISRVLYQFLKKKVHLYSENFLHFLYPELSSTYLLVDLNNASDLKSWIQRYNGIFSSLIEQQVIDDEIIDREEIDRKAMHLIIDFPAYDDKFITQHNTIKNDHPELHINDIFKKAVGNLLEEHRKKCKELYKISDDLFEFTEQYLKTPVIFFSNYDQETIFHLHHISYFSPLFIYHDFFYQVQFSQAWRYIAKQLTYLEAVSVIYKEDLLGIAFSTILSCGAVDCSNNRLPESILIGSCPEYMVRIIIIANYLKSNASSLSRQKLSTDITLLNNITCNKDTLPGIIAYSIFMANQPDSSLYCLAHITKITDDFFDRNHLPQWLVKYPKYFPVMLKHDYPELASHIIYYYTTMGNQKNEKFSPGLEEILSIKGTKEECRNFCEELSKRYNLLKIKNDQEGLDSEEDSEHEEVSESQDEEDFEREQNLTPTPRFC